ncbi:MAG: DegT/DnrJ/EryC1/StrS family aminotransferase [Limisphaerales bacterium]
MKVPFLDLAAQHESLRPEIHEAIDRVMRSSAFAGGPEVARFEEEFAAYCETRFAVGVGSGTEALWLSLLALGIGAGDEVITVPGTFLATAEAITWCGARPVFIDLDEQTQTMDPALLEAAITRRTRAIIPVHLFGQPADMDPIRVLAKKHGLRVIEDACQAHGARYRGRPAGSLGDCGCFSFYPGKNLGAMGEAGAVVTDNADLRQKLQVLRDHGQSRKYHHEKVGWNGRMDGIQAAVLRIKLRRLEGWNTARRSHAHRYRRQLAGLPGISLPEEAAYAHHVYHLYAVQLSDRDPILQSLTERGIACGIHYPVPVHLQPAYRSLEYPAGSFPVAEDCARRYLSLPMFPELTEDQVDTVSHALKECVGCAQPQLVHSP